MRKIILLSAVLLSLATSAQTKRGDFSYDGKFDMYDLTLLIDNLLSDDGTWEPQGLQRHTVTVKGEQFVMIHVDGGQLPSSDPYVTVNVPDFWIAQTEVTQKLWKAVMGKNPSNHQYDMMMPVESVSWYDCQAFIDTLNALTGLQFRLPSAYEWEFAARGGNLSKGYKYAGGDNLDVLAWYDKHGRQPKPVGMLGCNELGLYDMCGNVMEWCSNIGAGNSGMLCGGSWFHDSSYCVLTRRMTYALEGRLDKFGLRLTATTL